MDAQGCRKLIDDLEAKRQAGVLTVVQIVFDHAGKRKTGVGIFMGKTERGPLIQVGSEPDDVADVSYARLHEIKQMDTEAILAVAVGVMNAYKHLNP